MTPARQRPHAASDLARLVVVYLCLILAVQGFAAAQALGAGPLHRHTGSAGPASVAERAFSHHGHQHLTGQRHHHAETDPSVQHMAGPEHAALDAAAFALTAALALLALGASTGIAEHRRRHVWRAAKAWYCSSVASRLPFRPPRPA